MKNRSRVDLIATMLRSCRLGSTKSRIMYATYISHKQLSEYLDFMFRNKLINFNIQSNEIFPTKKGHDWLSIYEKMMEMTKK